MAKLTLAAVESLISNQTATIVAENKSLRDEVSSLRDEVKDLKVKLEALMGFCDYRSPSNTAESTDESNVVSPPPTFAEVVKKTLKSTLREESAMSDVIISKLEEKGEDRAVIAGLCQKMNCNVTPKETTRLGKKLTTQPTAHRPLKVSFPTPFDARTFRARFAECRKTGKEGIPDIRVRPWRNQADQARFASNITVTKHM